MKDSSTNKQPADDNLARLLKLAGPRAEPSAAIRREVYGEVHKAWQARTRRRDVIRRFVPLAVAASVLAVVAVTLWPPIQPTPVIAASVGTLDRGDLEFQSAGSWHVLQTGQQLTGHAPVRTGSDARAGVILVNGVSVRLDYDTQLLFETPQRLTLNYGRLYVDTAEQRTATGLEIVTAGGIVRDVGTQFEVLADASRTRVRVRDGEVILATTAENYRAVRGEQLTMLPGQGVTLSVFASNDAAWDWAYEIGPGFDTDGRLVSELVDWVVRETGRAATYADAMTRNAAASTRILGTVSGQNPEETLELALQTTRFKYRIDDHVLEIDRQ